MEAKLQHIFLNVSDPKKSFPFYTEFMGILGYKIEQQNDNQLGLNNGDTEIWLRAASLSGKFNRNSIGINHLAFRVKSKNSVDFFYDEFIKKNKLPTLFDSPRIFSDFTDDYYAVYFEDPDGLKLEVTFYTFEFH